MADWL